MAVREDKICFIYYEGFEGGEGKSLGVIVRREISFGWRYSPLIAEDRELGRGLRLRYLDYQQEVT